MAPKWKKIKNPETSRVYQDEAIDLALGYCPRIYPCKKCNHPVLDGFCCSTCGDNEPYKE